MTAARKFIRHPVNDSANLHVLDTTFPYYAFAIAETCKSDKDAGRRLREATASLVVGGFIYAYGGSS